MSYGSCCMVDSVVSVVTASSLAAVADIVPIDDDGGDDGLAINWEFNLIEFYALQFINESVCVIVLFDSWLVSIYIYLDRDS